jgi:hypothetical protein
MRTGLQKDGKRVTVDSRRKVSIQSDKYTSASKVYVSMLDCPLQKSSKECYKLLQIIYKWNKNT